MVSFPVPPLLQVPIRAISPACGLASFVIAPCSTDTIHLFDSAFPSLHADSRIQGNNSGNATTHRNAHERSRSRSTSDTRKLTRPRTIHRIHHHYHSPASKQAALGSC
ncbi:hypothetical protein K437DRAFT_124013 [Tilletiaria anomala UBC 951]|uniref:Uncharacterized protein n=1 Tax=Tilletiaria anomala (strain ATCC 24038 / CBS 436.72 / UBC 951) TaxID=1037660 RepID=A0A066VU32_TILAU|nr:uncharacterized protein K437DRAFT_124013 [Tilletiaria anomala UBC 951]KDN45232.1 hypothetical protein K437DRAFT_124013 [Tilletiaria anomala UBC 951]